MADLPKELVSVPIPIARGGINKDIEPTSLDGFFTPYMLNMVIEPRRVRKRLGYNQVGTNLPLKGTGMKIEEYVDARGTIHTLAFTTTHAYEYQADNNLWLQITPSVDLENCDSGWTAGADVTGVHDTTDKIRGTGSYKMTLDAELSDGDQIGYKDISSVDISAMTHIGFWIKSSVAIPANDIEVVISESNHAAGEKTGTYVEVTNDVAIVANTWTFFSIAKTLTSFDAVISCSIYANDTIASGAIIRLDDIRGYDEMAGDADKPYSLSLATDINEFTNNGGLALILSNQVDDLFYYEGHANNVLATLVHGYADFANCVTIAEFWNHFMLINFNNGNQNVRSIAHADIGDIDDFSAGTSGLAYLTDSVGKIVSAKKLKGDLIIYSTRSITTCQYHGSPVFLYPTLIYRTGLFTQEAVIALTNFHQIIGTDQRIYQYEGGSQLVSIGRSIEKSFFSELDSSKRSALRTGYNETKDWSLFCFPRAQDTYAKAAYIQNRAQPELPWMYFEFADSIRSIAMHENKVDLYCDSSQVSGIYCDESALYCDASSGESDYPVMISLSDDGYVYQHDEAFGKDDDANITCEYQTQDVTVDKEEHYARWEWFTFVAKSSIAGGTVNVYCSDDEGDTWTELDNSPFSLTSAWTVYRKPIDKVSRKIRFRFRQSSSSDLQIRDDMHVSAIPKTARD